MKTALWVAAAGVAVFFGIKAIQAWTRERRPGLQTVSLLGDSMSAGYTYRKTLEDWLGRGSSVARFGYPGKQTSYILDKVRAATKENPTAVVVLCGVNDLASGRGPEHVISNLNAIYLQIAAAVPHVYIVAVTLTPWGKHYRGSQLKEETEIVNDWIRFSSPTDAVIDTAVLGDGQGNLHPDLDSGDGLHLNLQGQIALATAVYQQGFE